MGGIDPHREARRFDPENEATSAARSTSATPTHDADELERARAELERTQAELGRLRAELAEARRQPPRRPIRWRSVTAVVLLVLAALLAPLSVTVVWLRTTLLDTNRYVETVAPLSSNPELQNAVDTYLTDQLFARVDVATRAREALPPRADFLAEPLSGQLKGFTHTVVSKAVASDQFKQVWVNANRAAHRQVVGVLTGKGGTALTSDAGVVTLDLRVLANNVKARLQQSGIGVFDKIPADKISGTFVLVDSPGLAKASRAVRLLDRLAVVLPLLTLALVAAGVWLARDRRRALLGAGAGLVLGMVVLAAGLSLGRSQFVQAVAGPNLPSSAAGFTFDTIVRFLRASLRTVFAVGLVVAVGAVLAGPSTLAVRLRTGVRGGLVRLGDRGQAAGWIPAPVAAWVARYKNALRVGAVTLAAVTLVVWSRPTPRVVLWLAVALLVVIAVIELLGRSPHRLAATADQAARPDGSAGTDAKPPAPVS
jgi:hypothetical protein